LEGDISVLLKSILLIFQPVIIANNSGEIWTGCLTSTSLKCYR
jgi:hypothetical protein